MACLSLDAYSSTGRRLTNSPCCRFSQSAWRSNLPLGICLCAYYARHNPEIIYAICTSGVRCAVLGLRERERVPRSLGCSKVRHPYAPAHSRFVHAYYNISVIGYCCRVMCVARESSTHSSSSVGVFFAVMHAATIAPCRCRPGAPRRPWEGIPLGSPRYSRLQQTFATTAASVVEKMSLFAPRAPFKQKHLTNVLV